VTGFGANREILVAALALALMALLPLAVTANTVLNFLVVGLILALAAQGWNILGGLGGQMSFGHAAFFGTGAYASALLQTAAGLNAWAALAGGIAAGALLALVVGVLVFRAGLRGSYFALVTLAVAEVLRILANASSATGGAAGLLLRLDPRPENLQFASRAHFYWLALAAVALALALTAWIVRSRFGAQLVALRENEDAARALGVDPLATKLKAIALSGAVTAAAGVLYLQYFLYIDAGIAFGPWISIEALLAPTIGGVGTVLGPVVGALALHGLSELAKSFSGGVPGIDLVVFGAVLILVVAFSPQGIVGLVRAKRFFGRAA
jgi:branched-chain amino acid transport system permease protein